MNSGEKQAQSSANGGDNRGSLAPALRFPLIIMFLFAAVLTALTLVIHGRVPAEKVATGLVMPVGLIWLGLIGISVWAWRNHGAKSGMFFLGIWVFVSICFNGRVANRFIGSIEHPDGLASENVQEPLAAVIVLGGGASYNLFQVDELNGGGERVFSAAQLWHAGKVQTIICTDALRPYRSGEISIPHQLLKSVGVPSGDIVEVVGPNTAAEMKAIRELLESDSELRNRKGKIGLITSAFHMHRAIRLAKASGVAKSVDGESTTGLVELVPLPCNYLSGANEPFQLKDIVPAASAGQTFAMAMKESLARIVSR